MTDSVDAGRRQLRARGPPRACRASLPRRPAPAPARPPPAGRRPAPRRRGRRASAPAAAAAAAARTVAGSRRDPARRRGGDRVERQVSRPGDRLRERGRGADHGRVVRAQRPVGHRQAQARAASAPSATSSRRRPFAATPPPRATAGTPWSTRGRAPAGRPAAARRPPDRRRRGPRAGPRAVLAQLRAPRRAARSSRRRTRSRRLPRPSASPIGKRNAARSPPARQPLERRPARVAEARAAGRPCRCASPAASSSVWPSSCGRAVVQSPGPGGCGRRRRPG